MARFARDFHPTATLHVRAANPSESAALQGRKAKTPILAGSIIGGVMGLAWIIGFGIYFYKRIRRKRRKAEIAAGLRAPYPKPEEPREKVIIPPDPAVLLGSHQPGERIDLSHQRHASSSSFASKLRRSKNNSENNQAPDEPPASQDSPQDAPVPQDESGANMAPAPIPPSPRPRHDTAVTATRISDEMTVPSHSTHV
ncbi:hypothetical protein HGRIS_002492 [Hohenbuehelia grisea]|uniref:Uncharacterized protein n=1 Tax=Hohenbuehelia grisea TaxID=104357 RepID=A0ABR3JLV7_9AGAR